MEKVVLSLANPDDMRLALQGVIENGYFGKPASLADVIKHLYIDRAEKVKEREVLDEVVRKLLKGRHLKRNESLFAS